jgi:hypothetical protein
MEFKESLIGYGLIVMSFVIKSTKDSEGNLKMTQVAMVISIARHIHMTAIETTSW